MKTLLVLFLVLLFAAAASAQTLPMQPVQPAWDWASYGTAAVNPGVAAYKAIRHKDWCKLGQLGISELIGNTVTIVVKRHVESPRPCFMCPPDGMPSGHSMNGAIGAWANGGWGYAFTVVTPFMRYEARRHTKKQAVFGTLLGVGSDAAGHLLRCNE